MNERENYLLFVPSLLTERAETITYIAGGEKYEGMQTNEAVTKYLADHLHGKGTKLNKIIMLSSKEVTDNKIGKANGRTTQEYYQEVIWDFLGKYRDDYGDRDSLFQMIPFKIESEPTAESIVEPIKQILKVTEETKPEKQEHGYADKYLYVDFTGGMRNAALMLVFACRILQRLGVTVDKILYSNVGAGTVEECTKTYAYFDFFEHLVKRESGQESSEWYTEYIHKHSLSQEEQEEVQMLAEGFKTLNESKEQNQFGKVADTSKQLFTKLKQMEKKAKKDSSSKDLEKLVMQMKEDVKEVQTFVDNDKYPELPMIEDLLKKKQYERAFNLYREKIINIMYEGQIIQVDKRFLKNSKDGKRKELKEYEITQEIIGVYCYYEHPDKKNYPHKVFMDAVSYGLEQLRQRPCDSPKKVIEETMGDWFYDATWYLNKGDIPSKSFMHTDFSRSISHKKILPYLEQDYGKSQIDEFVDKYNKLDRIYMGHGFPFAATYDKWFLNGYDRTYREILNNGWSCLQDFYEGRSNRTIQRMLRCFPEESFTYETLIEALPDERYEKMLHILFPYCVDKWKVSSNVFKGEEWDTFIYEFAKSFCFIKNVRNKKIHKSDLDSEEMKQAVKKMEHSLEMIRKYIR